MSDHIVFFSKSDIPQSWQTAFAKVRPGARFEVLSGAVTGPCDADFAVVWHPPHGELARMTKLKAIFSLGAGVDHVLGDPEFPSHVPLSRVVDPTLTAGMSEYVVLQVLALHRGLPGYIAAQRRGLWRPSAPKLARDVRVGIMGMGVLGRDAARKLAPFGYRLSGWSRSGFEEAGVECHRGADGLKAILRSTDILVCLLPLTAETRGILNRETLALLPAGAAILNAGRGAHIVDADLLAALDARHVSAAALDVFAEEPLPAPHRYWSHPGVIVTPHVASLTNADAVAARMSASMDRVNAGLPPFDLVDPARGY
jgi:glyoxylate/hydroxypyruvate reductase